MRQLLSAATLLLASNAVAAGQTLVTGSTIDNNRADGAACGASAVVVGAGGAARALMRALAERRVTTTVINRSPDAAKRLASEFGATSGDAARLDAGAFNLLLNATPSGDHLSRIPMPKAPGASTS